MAGPRPQSLPTTAPGGQRGWLATHPERAGQWAALAITALAAALRLPGLGEFWLNPDEGIYYSVISWPDLARRNAEIAENAHPPFFYHFLWLWSRVSMDLVWLRLPAALAGIVSVWGMFALGRALVGGNLGIVTGCLAALLLAVSPSAITLAQLIRPYTLQLALIVFALAGLARWQQHHDDAPQRARRGLVAFSLCATVALLTHYSSVFAFAAAAVPFVVLLLRGHLGRAALRQLALAAALPVAAMLTIYFVHMRPNLAGQALQQAAFEGWLRSYLATDLPRLWRLAIGFCGYVLGAPLAGAGITALLLGLGVTVWQRQPRLWIAALAAFAAAALASALRQYPFGPIRHSLFLTPFLLLPIAWSLARAALGSWRWRTSAAVAVALLLVAREPIYVTLSNNLRVSTLGDEQVLRRSELERARPVLDRLEASPGVVTLSVDSYYTLCPLWQEERTQARLVDGMRVFRWGQRDVVVHSEWSFSLQGSDLGKRPHVFDFLVNAGQRLPELQLDKHSRLPMLFAGFHPAAAQALLYFDRMRGSQQRLVNAVFMSIGLILIELDAARFLAEARAELNKVPGNQAVGR